MQQWRSFIIEHGIYSVSGHSRHAFRDYDPDSVIHMAMSLSHAAITGFVSDITCFVV